ncbi:MAG: glycosyltransferase, partial [Chloroflexi bacterium]|nr:glycosyltransferase [Chloroflexota bacterium]
HLHWLSTGFVSIESIGKLDGPVVWTLHDMWPFTGGCHYSGECTAYSVACGACPELKSSHSVDLSRLVLLRKLAAWKRLNLTVVAPTAWLARRARASRLFGSRPVEVIPLGIDTSTYRPVPIPLARELLGLPQDAKVVLFGALGGDYRKGRDLLDAALARADQSRATGDLQLIVFGSAGTTRSSDASTTRTRYLGHLTDDLSLAVAYSAADVMVVPSREDNFPLTALEALACGTPVVGFDSTGLADMVDHCQTGYLARSFDPDDLWRGIQWVLEDDARRRALAQQARDKAVRDFAIEKVAMAYRNLYQRVTSASASRLAPAE